MADTSIKLSGTYDSIEAYRILEEMQDMSVEYEEIKEEAEAAVTTATGAATTAQGHANNASTYAANAQTYAGNASTSADAAAGSASTASTAAGNALDSETAAASSASAASASETNAAASETAAAAAAAAAEADLAVIEAKYAQAILAAHPVGSFYESTDSTSPATLFGGTWQEQIPDGELIGTVAAFAGNTLPDGWLACDGTAVSRTTYANLFSKIGTTYGSGDGSTTFSLPNLTDKFIQGNNTAGTVKSAGLPNIWGDIRTNVITSNSNSGALSYGALAVSAPITSTDGMTTGSYKSARSLSIDASKANSIYGNSTTVQPPALTMRFAIFAGHSALYRWIRQS